jgi:hypothetical protein
MFETALKKGQANENGHRMLCARTQHAALSSAEKTFFSGAYLRIDTGMEIEAEVSPNLVRDLLPYRTLVLSVIARSGAEK